MKNNFFRKTTASLVTLLLASQSFASLVDKENYVQNGVLSPKKQKALVELGTNIYRGGYVPTHLQQRLDSLSLQVTQLTQANGVIEQQLRQSTLQKEALEKRLKEGEALHLQIQEQHKQALIEK